MERYGVEMNEREIAEFLARQGHGVLSFGGDEPYGVPISFGYDVLENRCIFQLVFSADSKKRAALDASVAVSLTTYEWNDVDDWRSVILNGSLVSIPNDTPDAVDAAEIFAECASLVSLSVFNEPTDELDVEWYELSIESMNGRESPVRESTYE